MKNMHALSVMLNWHCMRLLLLLLLLLLCGCQHVFEHLVTFGLYICSIDTSWLCSMILILIVLLKHKYATVFDSRFLYESLGLNCGSIWNTYMDLTKVNGKNRSLFDTFCYFTLIDGKFWSDLYSHRFIFQSLTFAWLEYI